MILNINFFLLSSFQVIFFVFQVLMFVIGNKTISEDNKILISVSFLLLNIIIGEVLEIIEIKEKKEIEEIKKEIEERKKEIEERKKEIKNLIRNRSRIPEEMV